MDPALQELIHGAGDPGDEVSVILRLRDPAVPPPGVRVVARFGDVVTARVLRASLEEVWADDATVSVKASHIYSPDVEPPSAENEPDATDDARRPSGVSETGRGVVLGFVDWGCDFVHPDLRRSDGSTRLLALWDHPSGPSASAEPYGYGRIIGREEIDAALLSADPYDALGYHPASFDTGLGAHGTHTLSIAAGNGRAGGSLGMAPDADIVFVNLGKREGHDVVPLGRSAELLEAIDYINNVAADRCVVVNLSLGRHAGAHTGQSLVERSMDHFVSSMPGRAIVQSSGNYYERRTHGSWQLTPGQTEEFTIEVDPSDATTNEVDIWYSGRDRLIVVLASPTLGLEKRVGLGSSAALRHNGSEIARVYHRAHDPNNGDNQCSIMLEPTPDSSQWQITLIADDVVDGRVHAWIERDSGCRACQSRLASREADPRTTTGTIANGFRTIVVGAYNAHRADSPVAPFSSSGPTRDGRQKPDILAPGVMELGARSHPHSGLLTSPYVRMSGTSMAAPAVAGAVALLFERGGHLGIEDTRRILLASCDPAAEDSDPRRVGAGKLNVRNALELVTPAPPPQRGIQSEERPHDAAVIGNDEFAAQQRPRDSDLGTVNNQQEQTVPDEHVGPPQAENLVVPAVDRYETTGAYERSPLWFAPPPQENTGAGHAADQPDEAEPDCGCSGVAQGNQDADSPKDVSVAVIGGGLSGLMAASRLAQGGFTVTLFEANDRLGGRVWSRRDLVPGKTIEAGAELIGSNHPLWLRLARSHGLNMIRVPTEQDCTRRGLRTRWRLGGSDLTDAERKAIERELAPAKRLLGREAATVDRLRPWISPRAAEWDRLSVAQRLRQRDLLPDASSLARDYLEFVLGNDQCAPTDQQSYLGLLSAISSHRLGSDMQGYWEHTEDFRCAGGNQQLANKLAALVPDIRLTSAVTRLSLTSKGVEVTWERAGSSSRRAFTFAILTNSPATWPTVDSDPPFATKDYTVSNGPAVKYLTTSPSAYWERSGLAPSLLTDELGSVWESTERRGAVAGARPVVGVGLSVYSGGSYVLPGREYARRLNQCFPGYSRNVTAEVLVDWPADQWTRTGYAIPRPGEVTTIMKRLSRPFGGRLVFAGEQASPGFFGYMEGALDAGLRAAYLVASAAAVLRPSRRSARPGGAAEFTSASPSAELPPALADPRGFFDRLGTPRLEFPAERDGDLEVLAAPAEPLAVTLDSGDMLVTRGRGSPHVNVAVVVSPEICLLEELPTAGMVSDSRLPGRYVRVFDPVLHPGETHFARRVADDRGMVPPNTLIVRDNRRTRFGDGGEISEASTGCVPAAEPAPGGRSPHPVLRRNVRRSSVGYAQQCLNVFLARYRQGTLVCHVMNDEVRGVLSRTTDALAAAGQSPLIVDCTFGQHTELALKAFQACSGLDRDGVVGADTWPALRALSVTPPVRSSTTRPPAMQDCQRATNSITPLRAWERQFLSVVNDRTVDEFAAMALVIGPVFNPGMQVAPVLRDLVRIALRGRSAITIGNTVWFPEPIDTSTPRDLTWLTHESVHVLDYAAAGVETFLLAYAATAVTAGFEHDRIPSEIRANRFEAAAEALLARHPALRAHIAACNGDTITAHLRANGATYRETVNAHLAPGTQ